MTAERRRPGSEAFSRLKALASKVLGGGEQRNQNVAGDPARDDTDEAGTLAARAARWMEEWGYSAPDNGAKKPSTTREKK